MTWRVDWLDERERKEVEFAEVYAEKFRHVTDGHNRLLLLAKLAKLLDVISGVREPDPPPPTPAEAAIVAAQSKAIGRQVKS